MKIIRKRQRARAVDYSLDFLLVKDPNCGYSFPCDSDGNLDTKDKNYQSWKSNYEKCEKEIALWTGKYTRNVVKNIREYIEPAVGICEKCGEEVELNDVYYATCQCGNCGTWYNMFGQRCNPPSEWKGDLDEDAEVW